MIKIVIKEFFLTNPSTMLRVRELERALNLSLPSVIQYCKELTKENILRVHKIGSTTFYTSNKTSQQYLKEKKLHNLRTIYDSGIIKHIKQELSNPPIVLFGSYAKGEDIETSDVDLYVETPSIKKLNLKLFEQKLSRTIQIHRQKSLKEIKNKHLANNIINGITLNNQVEVFK